MKHAVAPLEISRTIAVYRQGHWCCHCSHSSKRRTLYLMPSGKAGPHMHGSWLHAVHRPYPDAQLKQRWHLGAAATHAATALHCHLQALLMLAELLVQRCI